MTHTLVELKSLSKSFGGNLLLEDVSFKLKKGEITTLLGQNGAGKTTLAKIIMGLETYDKGQRKLRNALKIGYVPQKIDHSFGMPIAAKDLIRILAPGMDSSQILDFSDFFNYKEIKNKDISSLSGGELQKLMLAGTLMNKPDLLILDEPTQYLDVTSQQEFYRLLSDLKKKMHLTIFMISHDLFTVMRNSDQVICLNGHVCCTGKPADMEKNIDLKNALSEIGFYVHKHDHDHKH